MGDKKKLAEHTVISFKRFFFKSFNYTSLSAYISYGILYQRLQQNC